MPFFVGARVGQLGFMSRHIAVGFNRGRAAVMTTGARAGLAAMAVVAGVAAAEPPAPAPAHAAPPPDKSAYTLFHPTPRPLMREMITDRPDKTESAYTVDAGHFQVEMDFLTYSRDHDTAQGADTVTTRWAVAPVNFKMGLLNNVDLQVMVESWNKVQTQDRAAGSSLHQSGFGDVTPRLKVNLWGNDGGRTALALMPFVKVPTSQNEMGNRAVEGGLIVPLAVELPWGFSMGVMTELDWIRNEAGTRHHPSFVNSLTVGHDLIGKLAGYAEFFSEVSSEPRTPWVGTVDFGLTYEFTRDIRLDGGINIGVTRSADDLNPFIGISFRY